jgi:hypothetical protein
VTGWDADLVAANQAIDSAVMFDILGSRRQIIFVEGKETSLDKSLYNVTFPGISVVAKDSCKDVENAVRGIRDADQFHWLQPFGIVDNDRRSEEDLLKLRGHHIFALPVFSVESVYYHPDIQRRMAERHAAVTGADANASLELARDAAVGAIAQHMDRLTARGVEKNLRHIAMSQLPKWRDIQSGGDIKIDINCSQELEKEKNKFSEAVHSKNLYYLICGYPVRETPALSIISKENFTEFL